MSQIEKNKEILMEFRKLIDKFNEDLEKLEDKSGFYINLDLEQLNFAGTMKKKTILIPREVCIF